MAINQSKRTFFCIVLTVGSLVVGSVVIALASLRPYLSTTYASGYHTQDIIKLNPDVNNLNTLLCSQYRINSLFNDMDIYLLPSQAVVNKNSTINVTKTVVNLYSKTNIEERGYRLLPGSSIDISSCYSRGAPVETLVFKGDDNLDRWKSDRKCESCVWKRVKVDSTTNCSLQTYVNLTAYVTSLDNYHTVIARTTEGQKPYPISYFTSNIKISRTFYDVTGYTEVCHDEKPCLLNLTYNTQPDIVVQFYSDRLLTKASLFTMCEARIIFWLGTMLILPVCVLLVAVPVIWFIVR